MSLNEYKRKRNFRRTPEPAGGNTKHARGQQFVVQKHDASRLHFDFRLEHDGTLKSWAVPKGPNLDPAVKSLAVHVEDHPLEYAGFEGMIPEGEYGGGTVMVWDHGVWEPESDPEKGFKEGKLKFQLHGEKLRGSWALVRMGGRAGDDGKNWLLIKHRDKYARPSAKTDPLARKQRSVISGRTMEQIASDADRVWSSNSKAAATSRAKTKAKRGKTKVAVKKSRSKKNGRGSLSPITANDLTKLSGARRAKQPTEFKPQLATLASRVPDGDVWLHELKFDGYRAVAFFENGKVRLVSRNGNDWTARFRNVADALETLPIKNAILDGEVVALDETGRTNFQQLQNQLKRGDDDSLVEYLFDVPHYEGFDLTQTPLVDRKPVLARLVHSANPKNEGAFRYSDHIQGQGEAVLQNACRSQMEGIISKRADSTYQQYRTSSWLKVKCLKQQEFVIGGYSKPEGSRVGFGALLLGYHDHGKLIYAGRVGTGFTTQSLRELAAELKKRRIDSPQFKNPPIGSERRGVTWVKPELVAEVEFTEWTSDGRLRHPSFLGLREDKSPKQVVREIEKSTTAIERAASNGSVKGKMNTKKSAAKRKDRGSRKSKSTAVSRNSQNGVVIAGVQLSNPDRVLYPEKGITKQQLAEYYVQIADWFLPHVVERPLTLVRCPEGYTGECFFQKHLTGSLPDAVRGVMVPVKGKREEYVAVDDIAGVVALVQMGVLEIHPWPAREDQLEKPDRIVFDLDPGEGAEWKAVVNGAKEVRDRLEAVGLTSYLRTSGGKGLHVVVPLARRNTWDELKEFAKSVADTMTREAPDRYLATMSKAKRRGKVFVDYLRNQRGATAIASYSTRARAGAPVAVPLALDELSTRTKPDMYNVENLPKRLQKLKADPWDGFFSARQSITRKMIAAFK